MNLFSLNNFNSNPKVKEAFDNAEYIIFPLESLDAIWEMAIKYQTFLTEVYRIDADLRKLGDQKNATQFWAAVTTFVEAFEKSWPDSAPLPSYLVALRDEIANLRNGARSRLFVVDRVERGGGHRKPSKPRNPRKHHSPRKLCNLSWQAQAAGFLRLFMDRDGAGSQKASAAKIANALAAGGVLAPGPRKKPYRGRTVIEWKRTAERGETAFAKNYQDFVSLNARDASTPGQLERDLEAFAELLKREVF